MKVTEQAATTTIIPRATNKPKSLLSPPPKPMRYKMICHTGLIIVEFVWVDVVSVMVSIVKVSLPVEVAVLVPVVVVGVVVVTDWVIVSVPVDVAGNVVVVGVVVNICFVVISVLVAVVSTDVLNVVEDTVVVGEVVRT
jgi:hypothetical protein